MSDHQGGYQPRLGDAPLRWTQYGGEWAISDDFPGQRRLYVNGWDIQLAATQVCAAMGITDLNYRTDWTPLVGWLNDGFCPDDEIVPVICRVAQRQSAAGIASLRYFDRAVREYAARNPSRSRHDPVAQTAARQ